MEQRPLGVGSTAWPLQVEQRRLPLATLGHGRAHLSDKVQAHIHQSWLEYGGNIDRLRAANCDVRGVLSDSGTEFQIGDYVDVLDHAYSSTKAPVTVPEGYLYPLPL